jgi:hypothetical protein
VRKANRHGQRAPYDLTLADLPAPTVRFRTVALHENATHLGEYVLLAEAPVEPL